MPGRRAVLDTSVLVSAIDAALKIDEKVHGQSSHDVAIDLTNVGAIALREKEFDASISAVTRAIAIEEGLPGHDQADVEQMHKQLAIATAARWHRSTGASLFIWDIPAGSAADKAGMKVGDGILSYDGKQVRTTEELATQANDDAGTLAALNIVREGHKRRLHVARGPLGFGLLTVEH